MHHGKAKATRTLKFCEPIALHIAIEPIPRFAKATDCTISGICAPSATTTAPTPMPSTAASIPSKSPSQQVNIEEDEKAIDSARLLSVRMIGVGGAVGAITGVVLSTIGVLNESATVCAVLGYGTGSIISFAAAEINFGVAWSEIPAHVSAWSLPKWIVTVCMVLH